jgi:two-component system, LuxR family, response regulator FixJ
MISNIHVFVVDEDPSVRKGLVRLLSNAGYEVSQFTSLNGFMDVIKPGLSGCIVLDSGIPGLSEKDLQAEFKKHGVCLPIIIISADDNSKIRQRAHEMKAAGLFRKPIDGVALIDTIDWVIQTEQRKNK